LHQKNSADYLTRDQQKAVYISVQHVITYTLDTTYEHFSAKVRPSSDFTKMLFITSSSVQKQLTLWQMCCCF